LRAYFMAVIVIATVPIGALTAYLISQQIIDARAQLEAGLQRSASAFAVTVEREIVSSIDALYILSYSNALQQGDIAGFFGTLTGLPTLRSSWSSAYLLDLDGNLLFNMQQAPGRPLGKLQDLEALQRLKRTREPVLTGVLRGTNGEFTTGILVPVEINGDLKYALGAWIDTGSWARLMTGSGIDQGGFVSLFDARFRIIARNRDPARFVGSEIPADAKPPMLGRPHGILTAPSLSGGSSYVAWQKIESSGWGVAVGVPADPINQANAMSLATALGAGATSLLAGLALAWLVSRRVTTPLRALASQGLDDALLRRSEVVELARLQDALQSAHAQRETARERLQSKADEFETLFHSSPIGLAVAQDSDCQHVMRNPALLALFNVQPNGELPPHRTLVDGAEMPLSEQPLRRAARGLTTRDVELEIVHEDGRRLRLIAHAVPLYDAAGLPRGAIGAYTDISERKWAQDALIHTERRLRESQHLVELAQAAGHVGFFNHQFAADAVTWTSGLARLFGLDLWEFESSWEAWLEHIDPQDRDDVQRAVQQARKRGEDQATFEFRVQHRDGSERWLSGRAVLVYDGAQQPLHMIGVVVDVTQQKNVERDRAEFVAREHIARVEAETANRAKDEFLAMLGHELRNPLGAIAAASEVLNRVASDHDAAIRARLIITRQTRHLARLMDDLLDVARVIAGKITLSRSPLDMAQAAQRLVSTLEVSGTMKGHQVSLDLHEVWANADGTRLEQIVNNLLTNALKYTPEGGSISVSVRAEGDDAVLEVKDSGVGMSPGLLSRVFDLFVQGERSLDRRQGGLGIGLTLVRRLTELHGGTVSASSDGPGLGSVFTVRIPRVADGIEPQLPAPHATPTTADNRRVVVVEDNEDASEALRALLELGGHRVSTVADGMEGVREVMEAKPDIALIDIGLPSLNGYEVAQRLRQAGHRGMLVALSGYGQPQDVARAIAAGFNAHLVKPVDPDALQALVKSAV
jgi:PAS domain S-box-containing protein